MIKVGFCVAYDWELLKNSIPRVYAHADIICLALDKDRKSWSGNKFDFDDKAFYDFVQSIDTDKKITIYEDCFSLPELNARQNCNRHRMLIAEKMGKGGWHIQVDSDEYFLDFGAFVDELTRIHKSPTGKEKPINVCPMLIPIFKKIENGFLLVDFKSKLPETAPFATSKPDYQSARQNGHFNILVPVFVLHETWARNEADLWFKLNNWGHAAEELKSDEVKLNYFNTWKNLNLNNYDKVENIHFVNPGAWPALRYEKGNTVEELIKNFQPPKISWLWLRLAIKNSRFMARLNHYILKPLFG
jgi:hypothetical protein